MLRIHTAAQSAEMPMSRYFSKGAIKTPVNPSRMPSVFTLIERPRHAAEQHEGAGGAGIGHLHNLFIGCVLFEIDQRLVELAQEMMHRVAEHRVLLHPAR